MSRASPRSAVTAENALYRTAIDLTIAVLTKRARTFRNQVVAIVAVAVWWIVLALMLRAPWPLAGLASLVSVSGVFLCLDARRVADWRAEVLAVWARRDIDLLAFSHAMRSSPSLPPHTLDAMLDLLGGPSVGVDERSASSATRRWVAVVVGRTDAVAWQLIATKVCAAALLAAAFCAAAAVPDWRWSAAALVIPAVSLISRGLRTLSRCRTHVAIDEARRDSDVDIAVFERLMTHLRPADTAASRPSAVGRSRRG